jgi:3-oxoadipate enol-lactonase
MPKQRVGDIEIYYEVHSDGPQTLVLIRGLGSNLCAWYEQTPEFARQFRTVVFDNRGAGRTDKPDASYSIAQMAGDVAGLMDALGIRRAALLGISMGGMIAQEFALHYPEKLSCLILGCTNFGGRDVIQANPTIVGAVVAGVSADPTVQKLQLQATFADDTIEGHPEVIAKDAQMRAMYAIPPAAFMRQVQAIQNFDAGGRLGLIKVPTMVIGGRDDRLVPFENSRQIAARIPGAKLVELPGGHLFFVEHPIEFNRAVIDFVKEHP